MNQKQSREAKPMDLKGSFSLMFTLVLLLLGFQLLGDQGLTPFCVRIINR